MAQKTINDSPRTTDTILLQVSTPDANGCYLANPYEVESVIVYYVQRSFSSTQFGEYDQPQVTDSLLQSLQAAQTVYCANPTPSNLVLLQNLQAQVANASVNTFYYSNIKPVLILGGEQYPAWLSTDIPHSLLTNVPTDSNGNTQYGQFQYL